MYMKKKFFFFLMVAIQIPFPFCYAQETWNLKQCTDYALANNVSVQQQDIQARLDKLTYNQSKSGQLPSLNFSGSTALNTGRSIDRTTNQYTTQNVFYSEFGLQARADVFNFFSKRNTIAANRYAAEASLASVEKLKADVSLNVAAAYLQALLNRQQTEISNVQVQQTAAQLFNTRKLVKAGNLAYLNEVELEAKLAQDSSGLVSAREAETQALLYLKALLNLDAATPFQIEALPVDQIPLESISGLQPEAIYKQALVRLPGQQVANLQLRSAQKSVEAAKGALYPTVSIGATLQTNFSNAKNRAEVSGYNMQGYSKIGVVEGTSDSVIVPVRSAEYRYFADNIGSQLSNNFGNSISMAITVPIFNGSAARDNLQRAKLKVKTYELQQVHDNMTLKQDIYKAYTDALTSLQKSNAAAKSLEAAQKAFDLASKRYGIGLLSTLELITVQNNLFNARLQSLLTQYDYVFKMKVIEFYKGQGLKL